MNCKKNVKTLKQFYNGNYYEIHCAQKHCPSCHEIQSKKGRIKIIKGAFDELFTYPWYLVHV